MPGGRPTKYHEGLPQMLLEHMEDGLSFASFGAKADVCIDTLYHWTKLYPEFSDAKKRATLRSLLFWEQIGRDFTTGGDNTYILLEDPKTGSTKMVQKPFSAPTYIYTMKCRFRKFGYNENDTTDDVDKFLKPPRNPSLEPEES